MKLKISQKDKSLLMIVLGILIIAASYYLGFRNFQSETKKVKEQNEVLDTQIEVLENIAEMKDMYIAETKELSEGMEENLTKFPADMISEEVVLYMKGLEQSTGAYVSTITMPERINIPINQQYEENKLAATEDVTGVIAENSFVNDGIVPDTGNMYLSCVESEVAYSITYQGLKRMIKNITEDTNRKSVDNISLVFNENTGNLSGTMTVNYFVLSGTGKEYLQPEASGTLKGINCIFGTLNDTSVPNDTEE